MELWVGCVVGALSDRDYRQKLAGAGFEAIDIEATRVYNVDDVREFLSAAGIDADATAPMQDKLISAFLRAPTPAKAARPLLRFNALQYVKAAA